MIYSLSIPCKAITHNQAYPSRSGGGRSLSKEGRHYKNFIRLSCLSQVQDFEVQKNSVLKATYIICKPEFLTKDGNPSRTAGDGDGFIKLLQDAIADAFDFDDSVVWDVRALKVYQETPRIFVELRWVPIENFFTPYPFLYDKKYNPVPSDLPL